MSISCLLELHYLPAASIPNLHGGHCFTCLTSKHCQDPCKPSILQNIAKLKNLKYWAKIGKYVLLFHRLFSTLAFGIIIFMFLDFRKKIYITFWQGWAPHSFLFVTFRSFPFFKRNILFFSNLYSNFWRLMRPKRTLHSFPLFSKERKRTQRTQRSFAKNGKERK